MVSISAVYRHKAVEHFQKTGEFKSERTKHGSETSYYYYGCRCDVCVAYGKENPRTSSPEDRKRNYQKLRKHFQETGEFLTPGTQHGTAYSAMRYGCRCEPCRTYYQEHMAPKASVMLKDYFARAKAHFETTGEFISDKITHGSIVAHRSGCRCDVCVTASRERNAIYRKSKKRKENQF